MKRFAVLCRLLGCECHQHAISPSGQRPTMLICLTVVVWTARRQTQTLLKKERLQNLGQQEECLFLLQWGTSPLKGLSLPCTAVPQISVFPALKTIDHTTSCSACGLMWAWKALPRQHCGQVKGSTNRITPLFASLPSLGSSRCLFR